MTEAKRSGSGRTQLSRETLSQWVAAVIALLSLGLLAVMLQRAELRDIKTIKEVSREVEG